MGMFHPSGSVDLNRATPVRARIVRALMASAVLAAALTLAGCFGEEGYDIPGRAMKELSPQMLATLQQKNMPKDSPLLIRIFKEESELEVWKQDTSGRYALLKVYPICRWSGDLGPKVKEGDRQAPEGFYPLTPGLMNPNSNYYLAINTGFPNVYDRANNRHGAFLMIHGDCSSRGCYAMTDEEIGEIYSLARDAFLGGQKEIQLQAYPFHMTPANLARHRNNPNLAFWQMIKQGDDHFQVSHLEPKVNVCDRRYVFDAVSPDNPAKPLNFNPIGRCPKFEIDPTIASAVAAKQQIDNSKYAELVRENVAEAPLATDTDGGMNRVFISRLDNATYTYDDSGHIHVPPLQPGRLPPAISPPRGSEFGYDGGDCRTSRRARLGRQYVRQHVQLSPVRGAGRRVGRFQARDSSTVCSDRSTRPPRNRHRPCPRRSGRRPSRIPRRGCGPRCGLPRWRLPASIRKLSRARRSRSRSKWRPASRSLPLRSRPMRTPRQRTTMAA